MIWHSTMTMKFLHRDTAAAWREAVLYIIGAFLVILRKRGLLWIGPVFLFAIRKCAITVVCIVQPADHQGEYKNSDRSR